MPVKREYVIERKKDFVWDYVRPCLMAAKPHLDCAYYLGSEIALTQEESRYIQLHANDEYVVVTCENGYRYFVNVSGNSLCAIASAVFDAMSGK